ncbi:glycosyltransferase family 4 protein [Candidatus Saccharibacteria bacterium]|nr:glycosyltransferase family 4 protein [Candidatus Saccharibacteria bacterium]
MKLAIDARFVGKTGIGTYTANLLRSDLYSVALGDPKILKEFGKKVIPFTEKVYHLGEQTHFPKKTLVSEKIDLLHVPHYNIPLFYRAPLAVTIHDVTPIAFSPYHRSKLYPYTIFMIKESLKKAEIVFAPSKYSKSDLLKYFPKTDSDKIHVIYNSVDDRFRHKSAKEVAYLYQKYPKISRDKALLLFVGLQAAHKNLPMLLEAFRALPRDKYQLIIIGGGTKAEMDAVATSVSSSGTKNGVVFTGHLTPDKIIDFYNLVDLFVFPSLYEGFGLPVLEALKCGTPVVSSNLTSLPEVGGKFVTYCDPTDSSDIAEKIKETVGKPLKSGLDAWLSQFSIEAQVSAMQKVYQKYSREQQNA